MLRVLSGGFVFLSILLSAGQAWSSTPSDGKWIADLDHGTGNVEFRAIGRPSAIKIVGKGTAPHGTATVSGKEVKGDFTFDLSSLDTGIGLRNHHMKEKYLQTDKYPEAKLSITKMTLPQEISSASFTDQSIPFSGALQLHGQTKPISGTASVAKNGSTVQLTANFPLKLQEWGIDVPKYMGITVAEDVQVAVNDSAPIQSATGAASSSKK